MATSHAAAPFGDLMHGRGFVVLDGALATELERRGADLRDALWSARLLIEQPELISAVHCDYLEAGADVITTSSYQATFEGFARRGLDEREASELMRLSVQLAVQARDAFWRDPAHRAGRQRPLVAASVGPYGAMLADGSEYRGGYGIGEAELRDFHRPRLQLLAAAGADLIACETIPCVAEARALAVLLSKLPGCTGWISFSCRDAVHTCEGELLADAVRALEPFDAVAAVGVNCTAPEHVESLVAIAAENTRKPVLAYPNSGEVYDAVAKCWHLVPRGAEAAERGLSGRADSDAAVERGVIRGASAPVIDDGADTAFAHLARRWQRAGARLIGGCCRTTPYDIRALRRLANSGSFDAR
jgi:homocysteine S-methyltransferase